MDRLGLEVAATCISKAYIDTGFRHMEGITEEVIDAAIDKYYKTGYVPWVMFVYHAKLFPEANPDPNAFQYVAQKKKGQHGSKGRNTKKKN